MRMLPDLDANAAKNEGAAGLFHHLRRGKSPRWGIAAGREERAPHGRYGALSQE
jgi:hypothetical protein